MSLKESTNRALPTTTIKKMFNPTLAEIEEAYSKGHSMQTDTNASGKYTAYQQATAIGNFEQQVDGVLGGSGFKSNCGKVSAEIPMAVRGFNIPATLFRTKDNHILLFY